MKAAIIGAGIHGSSTALALVRRGHSVDLFEQFPLGHDRGSSHGDSRIVRRAYPNTFYTQIMQEGYPLWNELERQSGKKLLYECGLLYFGDASNENIRSVIASLQSLRVEHTVLAGREAKRVFPELILADHEVGVFTPEAGWVHASLALQATIDLAVSQGANVRHDRIVDIEALRQNYDQIILCQGAWINQFLNLPVVVTLQTFGYIDGRHGGPVWIEEGPGSMYGFPSEPWGPGIKAGVHYKDQPFDPDEPGREPAEGAIRLIEDFARRRFGFQLPAVSRAKACLYTNTASEDFILGQLDDQVLYVSPCSGHGFKFGPWMGKTLADLADGKKSVADFPRWAF